MYDGNVRVRGSVHLSMNTCVRARVALGALLLVVRVVGITAKGVGISSHKFSTLPSKKFVEKCNESDLNIIMPC